MSDAAIDQTAAGTAVQTRATRLEVRSKRLSKTVERFFYVALVMAEVGWVAALVFLALHVR